MSAKRFRQCPALAMPDMAACTLAKGHAGPHVAMSESAAFQDDLGRILRALDLGDHARPCSPHQVVITEVLPAIERLRVGQHSLEMARRAMREAVIWLRLE